MTMRPFAGHFHPSTEPEEVERVTKEEFDNMVQPAGTKYDQGKTRLELLDPYAIEQLGRVLTFGAGKYGARNWMKGIAYTRLIGAALRHLFAFVNGEDTDKESGLPHLAHCMCCIMFLLGMSQIHPEMDDRRNV